ncbi:MAG: preprotein translocase subunit SecE, partial [Patescibacteria group bacterium]
SVVFDGGWAKAGSGTSFEHIKMLNKLTTYLKEVRLELSKVNWPSREQTTRYTFLVIGVSLAVAFFLGGLDYIFSWVLNKFVL